MEYAKKPSTSRATKSAVINAQIQRAEQTASLQRQKGIGRELSRFMARPVSVQRQVAQPPLRAAALEQQEIQRLSEQQTQVQRQVDAIQHQYSAAELSGAVQRQQALALPTNPPRQPQSSADWVTVMRSQAEQIEGRWVSSREDASFKQLQRQVSQTLVQRYRADRQPPAARHAEYAGHLATLQRHPISASVSQVFMSQVPQAERPILQRAVDELLQREQADAKTASAAHQLTGLQHQKAELDAQAAQPIMQRIQERRGGGNALPAAVLQHLQKGLNHDLSGVRIHDDAEADKLAKGVNAIAFTSGKDIFFQSGKYDPNSQSGLELLAHEVTHTVQQSKGHVGKGIDPDAGLESEARDMGKKLSQVMPSPKSLIPPIPHLDGQHAPGKYSQGQALKRAQDATVSHMALKPLYDLQPQNVQRAAAGDMTLQRLGNPISWVADKVKDGAGYLADKGKELIANGLKVIPGYAELCMAFGKDLVTGNAISGSADSILTALTNWVPGPLKDIMRALKETNVIGKAWEWFKGELGKLDLGGALGEIASAIGSADLGKAKNAVTRRISGIKNLIVGSANKIAEIAMTVITAGLGPLGQKIMAGLRGAQSSIIQILKDPVKFAKNLIESVKGGFKQFATNAPKHLQNGIGQWLTGSTGIAFPAKFDLQGVFMTALTVMGLTYQNMRGKLVKALGAGGNEKVSKAESTVDALKTMKGGLDKAQEMKGEQGSTGAAIQDGIKSEVTKSLVMAGIQKLVTMLIPGGGFINAIIGAFQTVQTIIQQGAQIAQVVTSALSSVAAIAAGNISGAIGFIDRSLGGAIPVALAWLSKVIGLGNFGGKVKNIIQKVKGKLDKVVDKIVAKVKGIIEKLMGKGKGKKPGENQSDTAKRNKDLPEKEKQEKLKKATVAIRSAIKPMLDKGIEAKALNTMLISLKSKHDLTDLKINRQGGSFTIEATVNPTANVLKGIDPTDAAIITIANEVGREIMDDPQVRAVQERIVQQRQAGKGSIAEPIQLDPLDHYGAARDYRQSVASRSRGQQTIYNQNNHQLTHTQSQRHAKQTPGTTEVSVAGGGSYPKIAKSFLALKNSLKMQNPKWSDERAEREAAHLIDLASKGHLSGSAKQKYGQFAQEVVHLAFVVEPGRNDSAISFSAMLINNIKSGAMTFTQAFDGKIQGGGLYPPSQQGAVAAMNRVEQDIHVTPATRSASQASRSLKNKEQRDRQIEFCKIWIKQKMAYRKMDFDDADSLKKYISQSFRSDLKKEILSRLGRST